MRRLAELRIRTRLTIIIVMTCTIALLLAGVIIVAYDNHTYQSQKEKSLSAQAKILASAMTASLEFDDSRAAQEYLAQLATNPQIIVAAVYKSNGTLFASYSSSTSVQPPNLAEPQGSRVEGNQVIISSSILQGQRQVGSVYLQASIESLLSRITRYGGIFLLAIGVALLLTLPIALRLHYAIANPIYARSLIEASLDPLITISPNGEITDVNSATIDATGISRDKLIGTDFSNYFTEPTKAKESYLQVFKEGAVTDYPLTIRNINGKLIDVLYNASVYKDEHGEVLGVFAAARDVTARKQAELEINRRTAELQVANQELEAFSYSVSHDLRAPLRAIDGFSLALLEDCSDMLDDMGKGYLSRVRAATQRMGQLIDDMLELARISRVEMRHEAINLSTIAMEVLLDLKKSDENREVEWDVQPDLIAMGDPRLLRVVLDNLIGNAWKYTSRQSHPHIEFGAMSNPEGVTDYFVRDNGAGFNMTYADKLFGAFQRLHATTEFPGTGVGLAIVQRIIHRHGGRVRGEGVPDQGATFYFSLPK